MVPVSMPLTSAQAGESVCPPEDATSRRPLATRDRAPASDLFPVVYEQLRALAASYFRREPENHTLQPTALVHEAYLKLVDQADARCKDRAHFFAVAAQAMRRLLVDHARRRRAAKRRTPQHVTIAVADADAPFRDELNLLALDEALDRLARLDPRQARTVELRFFGNLTNEEVAEVLGVSPGTVKGDWRVARAWLLHALGGETDR